MSILGPDLGHTVKYNPLASGVSSGTPSGKGLYLTVYPSSRPNTDTIYESYIPLKLLLANLFRKLYSERKLGFKDLKHCFRNLVQTLTYTLNKEIVLSNGQKYNKKKRKDILLKLHKIPKLKLSFDNLSEFSRARAL